MSMTIEETNRAREKLERDILELLTNFKEDTGATPRSVYLHLYDNTEASGRRRPCISDVSVRCEL